MQDNFINSRPVKVLAISASPRNPSNSEVFLQEALGVLPTLRIQTDVTVYHFRGKNFRPCIACLQCFKNGGMCILQDDFESLRQLWLAADCIIYSLPVYVVGIPGVLKCFLDRLHNATGHYYSAHSPRHMKTITCLSQGCELYGGQELAMLDIMRHAALINSLYVAPDGSFLGAGGWCGSMESGRLAEKAIQGTEDYAISAETARSAVRRTVELAAIIQNGMGQMKELLGNDPRYQPYLQRMER